MTPEARRAYQAAWREANRDKLRASQREWRRRKKGSVSREEYLAALQAKRNDAAEIERKRAVKRDYYRKLRGSVSWDEYVANCKREAEERQARRCQTFTKSGNGKTQKSGSSSPAVTVRKPGRIVASLSWRGL